ncbi:MAG: CopD family protein [Aquisalimonadaceae bacterium]
MESDTAQVWVKVLHIITLLTWTAGLFYLPGLFIAHSRQMPQDEFVTLRRMTRLVYVSIASPAAVLAVISGTVLVFLLDELGGWLPLKLTGVALMMLYHIYCGYLLTELRSAPHAHEAYLYIALELIPATLVAIVLWLVLAKPI